MADDKAMGGANPGEPPMTPTRRRLMESRRAREAAGGATPPPAKPAGTAPAGQQAAEISGALPTEQTPAATTQPARPPASPEQQAEAAKAETPPARPAPAPRAATPSGDGGPPAGAPDVPPPARPAPSPVAERPAPPPRAVPAQGGPAGPAPAARPTGAGAAAPARRAPAAARPAPAAGAARPAAAGATAERLAAAVRREPEPAAGGGEQSQSLVYVWPHLVTIEFISALLLLLSMIVLSWVVNAPLEARANPDHTPNPSKAPWYFLNLQELLLHMHPALAGVLVPAGALTLIAMIPYFDRDTTDVGKWFGTAKATSIAIFVTIYTVIVEIAEIMFDARYPVKVLMSNLAQATGIDYFREVEPFGSAVLSMPNTIVPMLFMLGPIVPLMAFIHWRWKPNTREVMVALFTGFFVSYIILTIFGTFFRGQGMQLYWPWDPHMQRID